MTYRSLYARLAVDPPSGLGQGGTIETRAKETVDSDQETLFTQTELLAGRTAFTETKETIDRDREALGTGATELLGSGQTTHTFSKETIDNDREALQTGVVAAGTAERARVAGLLAKLSAPRRG